ncbi:hypothetical protein AC249_AIPGENE25953 [Exaiptasia diaphana]|nr:hypothetical protein AC249_AIPGENE25953 [Exaiptasia diaphana]
MLDLLYFQMKNTLKAIIDIITITENITDLLSASLVRVYTKQANNYSKHHRLAVSQSSKGYYEYGYGDIPKTNADHVDMSYESPIDRLADMAASSVGKALDEDSLDLVRSSIIQGNGSESPKRTLTEELNAEKEEAMNEQEYEENIARRSSKNDRPWTTD